MKQISDHTALIPIINNIVSKFADPEKLSDGYHKAADPLTLHQIKDAMAGILASNQDHNTSSEAIASRISDRVLERLSTVSTADDLSRELRPDLVDLYDLLCDMLRDAHCP